MRLFRFAGNEKEQENGGYVAGKGRVERVSGYLITLLVVTVMLLGVAALLGPHLGWQVDTVVSGSMTPTIDVGGVVISKKIDPRAVETGDIITFRSPTNGRVTTHRVMEVQTGDSLYFQTKGDANEDPDPFVVPASNVLGQVRLHIPYIGYATQYARSPIVSLLMLTVPGLIIIIIEMRGIWIELSEQEKRNKAKMAVAEGNK